MKTLNYFFRKTMMIVLVLIASALLLTGCGGKTDRKDGE